MQRAVHHTTHSIQSVVVDDTIGSCFGVKFDQVTSNKGNQ
jgi:hypothetical protein